MIWLDIVIIAFLVITIIISLKKGFVRELFSLLGVVLGIAAASRYYQKLDFLSGIIKNQNVERILMFFILFIATMLIVNIIGMILSKIFKWSSLGLLDHFGGFIFGFMKGILVIGIVLYFISKFPPALKIINQSPVSSAILRIVNDILALIWHKPEVTQYI